MISSLVIKENFGLNCFGHIDQSEAIRDELEVGVEFEGRGDDGVPRKNSGVIYQ